MDFQKHKQDFLSKKDKSSINQWDKKIIPLCNKINFIPEYCTTSSCSGRIVIIKKPDKKKKQIWFFKTHEKTNFNELKNQLEKIKSSDLIYFKVEPCALHVSCKNIESANKLIKIAKKSGWKKSGISIGKKIMAEMYSSESLEMPIKNQQNLIDENFLRILVKEANQKIEKTNKKIKNFKENL